MVDDQNTADPFALGSRVMVPWGLDVLPGTVVDSHGEGSYRRLVVSVDLPDAEEGQATQLVTFRAADLEAAARVASERQPGAWIQAYQYEEQLRKALERLIKTRQRIDASLERNVRAPDSEADFALDTEGHRLIIEAKSFSSNKAVSPEVIDKLLRLLLSSHASGALLVTNNRLSQAAAERLQEAIRDGLSIRAVQWHPSEDNAELDQAISDLLAAA